MSKIILTDNDDIDRHANIDLRSILSWFVVSSSNRTLQDVIEIGDSRLYALGYKTLYEALYFTDDEGFRKNGHLKDYF